MRKYAENTSVPVSRSREEIEKVLRNHGAHSFVFGDTRGRALLAFEMRDRRLRFYVPMPELNKSGSNERDVGRETRRRWRAMLLVLKAKLEAVASEIVSFDEEFLAHIVVQGNVTVGDRMVPEVVAALKSGKLPPLLGPGDES